MGLRAAEGELRSVLVVHGRNGVDDGEEGGVEETVGECEWFVDMRECWGDLKWNDVSRSVKTRRLLAHYIPVVTVTSTSPLNGDIAEAGS